MPLRSILTFTRRRRSFKMKTILILILLGLDYIHRFSATIPYQTNRNVQDIEKLKNGPLSSIEYFSAYRSRPLFATKQQIFSEGISDIERTNKKSGRYVTRSCSNKQPYPKITNDHFKTIPGVDEARRMPYIRTGITTSQREDQNPNTKSLATCRIH